MVFICRLCGKCENDSSGLAIFGEDGVKEALAYKVKLALDISIYEYDPLPKYICEACLGKLLYTFTFQECCRRTQILLRERFLRSKNWSQGGATSGTEEVLPRPPEQELIIDTALTEADQQTSDILHPQTNETPLGPKETDDMVVKEEQPIEVTNHVLRSVETQQDSISLEPNFQVIGNVQEKETNVSLVRQPPSNGPMAVFGHPFEFSAFLRNGLIDEIAKTVGSTKRKRRETKKRDPRNNGSSKRINRKNRNCNTVLQTSSVNNMGLVMPTLVLGIAANDQPPSSPTSITIESVQGGVQEISESSHTNECVQNMNECIPIHEVQEPVERTDVYIGPDMYEASSQPIRINENIVPPVIASDHSQDPNPTQDNALKIVDVFSVQESSSSNNSSNWHSPSNPTNSFEPQNTNNTSSWHSPAPASSCSPDFSQTPQDITNKSNDSIEPTLTSPEEEEEEDVLVVEIVKANKGSIAQHWEESPAGFKCKICKKSYKKLVKCENHIRNHLGIKPYECDICKRRYPKKRLLNEHYIFHTGKKLYQCKECDKSFRYRKNFKNHVESHVEVFHSCYLCEVCGKTFNLQFDYWNHKSSKHILSDNWTVAVD